MEYDKNFNLEFLSLFCLGSLQNKLKGRFERVSMENEGQVGLLEYVQNLTRKYYQNSVIVRQLSYNKNIKVNKIH